MMRRGFESCEEQDIRIRAIKEANIIFFIKTSGAGFVFYALYFIANGKKSQNHSLKIS